MATDPNQQAATSAIAAGLANRPVTVAALTATLVTVVGLIFNSITGLSTQITNISAGTVIIVPSHTVTGTSPSATFASDYLVCLNGPTTVMWGLSITHILILFGVVIILFGKKDFFSNFVGDLGKGIKVFKKEISEYKYIEKV